MQHQDSHFVRTAPSLIGIYGITLITKPGVLFVSGIIATERDRTGDLQLSNIRELLSRGRRVRLQRELSHAALRDHRSGRTPVYNLC